MAGNVANRDELASVEYAVEHLGTPLCLVLGHSSCGAVSAVVSEEHLPAEINRLCSQIRHAMDRARAASPLLDRDSLIAATVRMNVLESMERLLNGGPLLHERVRAGRLRLAGAIYQIDTGRVVWLESA